MKSTVMIRMPVRCDMVGRALPAQLKTTKQKISKQLIGRLHRYALERLELSGFKNAVSGWDVEVYTLDGENRVDDRTYCVRWMNAAGGYIEVIGILTTNGKPSLDHGLAVGEE